MLTFNEAIEKRGLKVPRIKSVAWHQAHQSKQATPRLFPEEREVLHRALVEAQGPLFTFNRVEEPYDEVQFSSRGLTDWYVIQFNRLNHLTP